ncbi:MAG: pitrilysin family protein [Pseudomonadota bacterium]
MTRFLTLCLSLFIFSFKADAFIKVQEITSPGGIKAWYTYDSTSPIISMSFSFAGGSSVDPKGKSGTAEMLSSMLMQGAGPMDKKALVAKMQDLAIGIDFNAGLDFFSGTLQTIHGNREESFQLLGLILTQPNLSLQALEHVRRLLLTHLSNIKKDPKALAQRSLSKALFPEHVYGRPTYGNEASVRSLKQKDIKSYLQKYLVKSDLIIGITGKISVTEAGRLLDMAFGKLPQGKPVTSVANTKPQNWKEPILVEQDIPQSTIVFAQKGWRYGHKNFVAADLLLYILGGGMTSRLMEEIRIKKGYAYYVGSWMNPRVHSGLVAGNLGTSHLQTGEAIDLLKSEWRRLQEHGVTQKEFENAKKYLINSFPLRFQSSAAVARYLKVYQIYQFDVNYFQKRQEIIENITLNELNELAKMLLKPDQLGIVVVGRPFGKEGKVSQE